MEVLAPVITHSFFVMVMGYQNHNFASTQEPENLVYADDAILLKKTEGLAIV